ncbi:MAG: deoxyribose-phosphate aldolase [Flavobacteriaceae bacterium]
MNLKNYLDSTYLKTASQAGLSEEENLKVAEQCIAEAISEDFKLVMIRPEVVALARKKVDEANSEVLVGTVIDFPDGNSEIFEKLKEAQQAIENGADELDFVIDYNAFKNGDIQKAKQEVYECTKLGLDHNKVVKWIIEVAALTSMEIVQLSALIKNVIISRFDESDYENVFVKSSTGFYKTPNGEPNGATVETIKLMLENAFPLPVKAAGGVRSFEEAGQMIRLGVKRIGTSSAKAIVDGGIAKGGY